MPRMACLTRSIMRCTASNEMESVFGKIYNLCSVMDIRWISKLLILETLLKSRDAVIVYVSACKGSDTRDYGDDCNPR